MTDLPTIFKEIISVKYQNKVTAIVLSNHSGRQLNGAPSALKAALEIDKKVPRAFEKVEISTDGGMCYEPSNYV
ncbi:hypothetical protein B0J13DRAFT_646742 [Dactylonectria estremocensis]|uniref:FMN-dependent dehydrogenase domain-containing protein n=1 Tax=Dactylonectria estremocensis TaxID=1079267 RepID=A0A9P9ILJ4_9HYPO|nr:hypothetical protein B0J13DRAFT_646742 [Dactylonectria estremocensis]